jgi:beta-galactosidase
VPSGRATGVEWAEIVRVRDAEVKGTFDGGALAGLPALTRRQTGKGSAWYLATRLKAEAIAALVQALLAEAGVPVSPVHEGTTAGWIETVRRGELTFVINHGTEPVKLTIEGTDLHSGDPTSGRVLEPQGVAIVVPDPSPDPTQVPA